MADKLRRTKDFINKRQNNFIQATTVDYAKWLEGSPTFITYFQLDPKYSTHDSVLETVHSLVDGSSPRKYKRVYDVAVYGINPLDVANDLEERGLLSRVNNEMVILPNTIKPNTDDFFVFQTEGLEEHLFRIKDVQFDKISPKKYYKTEFELSQYNYDYILNNLSGDYQSIYEGDDTSNSSIVELDKVVILEKAESVADKLINKYEIMFYDEDMDTFVFNDYKNDIIYWSPYVQKFMFNTKCMKLNTNDFMKEIWINDINEYDNPEIYKEKIYRGSIFKAVEDHKNNLNFNCNFISILDYDLKSTRNLPFFNSPYNYKLISPDSPAREDLIIHSNSVPLLFSENLKVFKDVEHYYKVHKMDELHLTRIEPYIKNGDLVYECREHELAPTQIYQAYTENNELYLEDVSISNFEGNFLLEKDNYLFSIILKYLKNELKLNEEILNKIEDLYLEDNIKNYIILPMIIHILKSNQKN